MDCIFKQCALSKDCGILEITGKMPKSFQSCSYAREEKKKAPEEKPQQETPKPTKKPKPKK